ncbi:hypothetical protein ACFE04_021968 [Oxalis oulophora]
MANNSSSSSSRRPAYPHFFKIILPSTIQQGKIAIPNVFVQNYGDCLSNPVFLEDPCGETWKLKLTSSPDGLLLLEDGWRDFAHHYSLSFGHLVSFRYQGNSLFQIVIFEQNASEIFYPPVTAPAHYEDTDETKTYESDHVSQKRNENNTTHPGTCSKKTKISSTAHPQTRSKKTKLSTTASSSRVPQNAPNRGVHHKKPMTTILVQPKVTKKFKKMIRSGSSEALKRARRFQTNNQYFVLMMAPTYIEEPKQVCVPLVFAEECFTGNEGKLSLQVGDDSSKTWDLKYKIYTKFRRCQMSNGWRPFVFENKLQLKDVCVFELINEDPITLKVTIFRETELAKPCSDEKTDLPEDFETASANAEPTEFNADPLGSQEALESVRVFKSNFSFFHVVMTSTYLRKLDIPKEFRAVHFPAALKTVLLQANGLSWPVTLVSSKDRVRQFSGGWNEFVKALELRAGDVCVFEFISKRPTKLKMTRFR